MYTDRLIHRLLTIADILGLSIYPWCIKILRHVYTRWFVLVHILSQSSMIEGMVRMGIYLLRISKTNVG